MSLLIKNISILDPAKKYQGVYDILIENKVISEISKNIKSSLPNIFDGTSLFIAPGFIDLHCHLRDPGFTHKEDLETGGKAALAGGFTTICSVPNTLPVIDNPILISNIIQRSNALGGPTILPISSISIGQKGIHPVDFEKNYKAGAVSFSDDGVDLNNIKITEKALSFSKKSKVRIALHEENPKYLNDPIKSELEGIKRDLDLLSKHGGSLHIMHVSLKESCELIKKAKEAKLDVTCEVTPHHLYFSKNDIKIKGTNAKCNPPLRSEEDRNYLIEALNDGLIDVVATDHAPHSAQEKNCLYENAPNGIIGFQSAFSVLLSFVYRGKLSLDRAIECLTLSPARVFNLNSKGKIGPGETGDLVILNIDKEYEFTEELIVSKSKNSPFVGEKFRGGPKATIHEGIIKYISKVL